MRKKALKIAAVLLIISLALEAHAVPRKKKRKPELMELPQWEVIEEVVNEGGELKSLEIIPPPSAEAYALLFLKGEGEEVALQEEGPLEEKEAELGTKEKALLEGLVGLVAGFSLGWAGGALGARSVKGNRDLAFRTSLAGIGLGTSLGSIPSVYFIGTHLFKDKGSFWGGLIGGVAGALAGAAISYPLRDFTLPTFVIPLMGTAGAALGYRYLMVPP